MKCEICEKDDLKSAISLIMHLRVHNVESQDYYDRYIKTIDEGLCKRCGAPTGFIRFGKGYREFCGYSCSTKTINESQEVRKKIKNTLKERYGNENYVNYEKCKETKLEKYGYEYFPTYDNLKKLTEEEENQRVNKIKETKLEKYGDSAYCNVDKIKKTKLERYGNENYRNTEKSKITYSSKTEEEKKQISINKRNGKLLLIKRMLKEFLEQNNINLDIIEVNANSYRLKCKVCNDEFDIQPQLIRKRFGENRVICKICNPNNNSISKVEVDLLNFIKDNTSHKVIACDRKIISPYEIDIYIPDLKIAFEFNGLYWHNELNKDKEYHLRKTNMCEGKGIHLIHIYEDDWNLKQDIVKSRILQCLNKSNKLYARQCIIKEIQYKEVRDFLNCNHIQGEVTSKINIGLYYENKLVSVMTFGNLRKNLGNISKDNHYEMLRFCNKINCTIIGGASKLFKYFIDKYNPDTIISYADRSWTMNNGNSLYDKLGLELYGFTKPNYFYVANTKRENRFKYRKDVLIKDGFDANKSEHDIMLKRKIYRIYDSGSLKYIWQK